MNTSKNVKTFSTKEIGSWQNGDGNSVVSLPSLQRGFVWDARRIENLWDSLLRGYPIGSFLMTLDNTHKLFQLLDGQQRATAIAIGMFNPWIKPAEHLWRVRGCPVLWLDINMENEEHRFKIVSHSQPWGYDKKSERMAAKDRRKAFDAIVQPKIDAGYGGKYYELKLSECWPWMSNVPVPFSFFFEPDIDHSNHQSAKSLILGKCEKRLEYISCLSGDKSKKLYRKAIEKFFSPNNIYSDSLLERVANIIDYEVPAIIVSDNINVSTSSTGSTDSWGGDDPETSNNEDNEEQQLLFQRINSEGVVPSGEELVYSIFKSLVPGAEMIGEKCDYIKPARTMQYAIRLVMAGNKKSASEFPPGVKIREFKEWLERDDNRETLTNLIKNIDKEDSPFMQARLLLTGGKAERSSWHLSFYQTCEIANGSPDAFFILLYRLKNGDSFDKEDCQKKALGFLTSLCWFVDKSGRGLTKACQAIWSHRYEKQDSFWSAPTLKSAIRYYAERGSFGLIPPCPPDGLKKLFAKLQESNLCLSELDDFSKMRELFRHQYFHKFYNCYFDETTNPDYYSGDDNSDPISPLSNLAMVKFVHMMRESDGLLVFICRQACYEWFDNYFKKTLEDTDRPWDRDHIYPQEYIRGKKVRNKKQYGFYLVVDWHSTIANIRLWPLELNRSDSCQLPSEKLHFSDNKERLLRFGIENEKELFKYSGINPEDAELWLNLGDSPKEKEQSLAIVKAFMGRMLFIYEEWYESLEVGKLFPSKT